VEQQASMLGMPPELWRNSWFGTELPELVDKLHTNTIYVPSTPSGGVLPFYTNVGVTHYYGVGAYLRDINDVRRSDVKFTSECLGFSNVPENGTIAKLMGNFSPVTHHPLWKSRVPRDSGAGWDFEDVRDHYLDELFDVDPAKLRSVDTDRYLALSRIASGEMMSQVFSEWRSVNSNCGGGLVWFYKDLWPGAGWGVLDSDNNPKAVYYYLKRAFRPVGLVITDEGLQGLYLHLINENPVPFTGTVEFNMLQNGNVSIAKIGRETSIPAAGKILLSADELLGGFYDTSYAYRFGPPKHEVSCATLKNSAGQIVSQQFHFPQKHVFPAVQAKVEALATQISENGYQLSITTDCFLYAVHIDCKGYFPEDNYFHLMPGEPKQIRLDSVENFSQKLQIHIRSENLQDAITPVVQD
jgi:beta-mannosidase